MNIFHSIYTAFRTLMRHKGFAAINIAGLAIAISSAQLIFMFTRHEYTYDKFHKNNVYRVVTDFKFNGVLDHLALSSPPLGPALKSDYPEVEKMTQLTQYNQGKTLVKQGEKKLYLENIFFADSVFFDIFSFRLLEGDASKALSEPNCVVLTKSTSELYFGDVDPMGKTLQFDQNDGTFASYKVTGILADPPRNSHLKFTALTSMPGLWAIYGETAKQSWVFAFMYTYITLKPGTDYHKFQDKLKDLYSRKTQGQDQNGVKASCDFIVEPMADIHLQSKRIWDTGEQGNKKYLDIFVIVAVFIILIACINYINLTTARAARRMKEIGIRKIAGANKTDLIMQVMGETLLIGIASLILASAVTMVSTGLLSKLTHVDFTWRDVADPVFIVSSVALLLAITILSGLYPAYYINKFNPAEVLHSRLIEIRQRVATGGITLRKFLVVFQFFISMVMVSATLIIYKQLHYMLGKDPGFKREKVVSVMLQDTLIASKYPYLRDELMKLPMVESVAYSASIPGGPPDRKITRVEGKTPSDLVEIPTQPVFMDFNYARLMEFKLKEGELIKQDSGTGFRKAFLINEAAAEKFGWRDALGKRIVFGFNPQSMRDGKVVGVLKNVQTTSFREAAEPMIFMVYKKPLAQTYVTVKLKQGDIHAAMASIEKVFSGFDPVHPFDPIILDDSIRKLYDSETRMSQLFTVFSCLTLFIACLGLFGLVSYTTLQRRKEIGIRKVMGASTLRIAFMVTRDFLVLPCIAFVLAIPVAWYGMHGWLLDFATRIDMPIPVFGISAFCTLLLACISIGFHTISAASRNPVNSLRYE